MKNYLNTEFWVVLDELVDNSEIIIDRPKGTAHPKYPDFIYKADYGYLKNTSSMDGDGIDIWVGSDSKKQLDAIMCIVDLTKRDSEIKLLIGCTEEEKEIVYATHNETEFMKGILIRRNDAVFSKDNLYKWLDEIFDPYFKNIAGIHFNLYQKSKYSWALELIATSSFDAKTSDWIQDVAFRTDDNLFIWTERTTPEDVEEKITNILMEYIENGEGKFRLLDRRGVGISFDGKPTKIIHTMSNHARFTYDICTTKEVEAGDFSKLTEIQKMTAMIFWYDATVNWNGHANYFHLYSDRSKDDLAKALKEVANEEILNNFLMAANTEDEKIWNKADDNHYKFEPSLSELLDEYVEKHIEKILAGTTPHIV